MSCGRFFLHVKEGKSREGLPGLPPNRLLAGQHRNHSPFQPQPHGMEHAARCPLSHSTPLSHNTHSTRSTRSAHRILDEVGAQLAAQLRLVDEEGVGQAVGLAVAALAQQPVEQRVQLLRGHVLGHVQLGACEKKEGQGERRALRAQRHRLAGPGRAAAACGRLGRPWRAGGVAMDRDLGPPVVSPSGDWNCMMTLAVGCSSLAFLGSGRGPLVAMALLA